MNTIACMVGLSTLDSNFQTFDQTRPRLSNDETAHGSFWDHRRKFDYLIIHLHRLNFVVLNFVSTNLEQSSVLIQTKSIAVWSHS
eukprot:jgi/Psemu1/300733/fgenesh1_kg.18_\